MKQKGVTFVLFGGTGDLTRRKLVPAFARLVHEKTLGKGSTIIGVSRKQWTNKEYKEFLLGGVRNPKERRHIKNLNIVHHRGDFSTPQGIKGLNETMKQCERQGRDRIYYLATGYQYFGNIVKGLKEQNLHKQPGGLTRVVFEKPFGNNLKSSKQLDKNIHLAFKEESVYRIDHYLAKDIVQNLNALKFTNPLLYGTYGNKNIDSIDIIVEEDLNVEDRIGYYDNAGALKDMIQNHLLQMLSIVLMERPKSLKDDHIHDAKVKVLKHLKPLGPKHHHLAQYTTYQKEAIAAGIHKSQTETYARITLNCTLPRWNGVKLTLITGKELPSKLGKIHLSYKNPHPKFTQGLSGISDNSITMNIYPKQDITIKVNTLPPGDKKTAETIELDYSQEQKFGPNTTNEYATLLKEVIIGDKTLFTRSDEVAESWKIIDKIEKMRPKIKHSRYKNKTCPETYKTI